MGCSRVCVVYLIAEMLPRRGVGASFNGELDAIICAVCIWRNDGKNIMFEFLICVGFYSMK